MAEQFGMSTLALDVETEADRIAEQIVSYTQRVRRKGAVVALSGGIDSSVTAGLCVRALGPERVFGIHMPERDSSPETLELSQSVSNAFGFDSAVEDLTSTLDALGAYRRRDDAIRLVCPEYGEGYLSKIVLPSVIDSDSYRLYSVVVRDPSGAEQRYRLTPEAYLGIVAATNFKQRARKMFEYYHADRLNFVTTGTPNRLEYDQGFFVKLGDGAADIKPIAHLYKTQVYQLAEFLGVPDEVRSRPSTTDTYSLPQSQEEFYFSLPHDRMDLCLYAHNNGVGVDEVATATGLTAEQVTRVFHDIDQKRRSTAYLHGSPVLTGEIPEI